MYNLHCIDPVLVHALTSVYMCAMCSLSKYDLLYLYLFSTHVHSHQLQSVTCSNSLTPSVKVEYPASNKRAISK